MTCWHIERVTRVDQSRVTYWIVRDGTSYPLGRYYGPPTTSLRKARRLLAKANERGDLPAYSVEKVT